MVMEVLDKDDSLGSVMEEEREDEKLQINHQEIHLEDINKEEINRLNSLTFHEFFREMLTNSTYQLYKADRFFQLWDMYQNIINNEISGHPHNVMMSKSEIKLLMCNMIVQLTELPDTLNRKNGKLIKKNGRIQIWDLMNDFVLKEITDHLTPFEVTHEVFDLLNEFLIQHILYKTLVQISPKPSISKPSFFYTKRYQNNQNRANESIIHYGFYMDKIEGISFNELLREKKEFTLMVDTLLFIIEFMDFLYNNYHFVHGDLKPDNILISHEGIIHFIDFGLSHIEFKGHKIFIGYEDMDLGPHLLHGGDYKMNYTQFIKSPYLYQSDIIYLLLTLRYYIDDDVPFMRRIHETLFTFGGEDMYEKMDSISNCFLYFILSKDLYILQKMYPNLNIPLFMENFHFEHIKNILLPFSSQN